MEGEETRDEREDEGERRISGKLHPLLPEALINPKASSGLRAGGRFGVLRGKHLTSRRDRVSYARDIDVRDPLLTAEGDGRRGKGDAYGRGMLWAFVVRREGDRWRLVVERR